MNIPIRPLRKFIMDLLEEHAPGKLGGMFCSCTLCKQSTELITELDKHPDGVLVFEKREVGETSELEEEDLSFNFRRNLDTPSEKSKTT